MLSRSGIEGTGACEGVMAGGDKAAGLPVTDIAFTARP
jgi:hypothetical protein